MSTEQVSTGMHRARRILVWYTHGSYVNALVRGHHRYLLLDDGPSESSWPRPTLPWPDTVELTTSAAVIAEPPDLVIIQRLEEITFCSEVLGFTPGEDVPAIFCEHNVPREDVPATRHPLADRPEWLIVHVSHFNAVMWDCGTTPQLVIGHGLPDAESAWQPRIDRAVAVINEPVRRTRVTGSDLLGTVAGTVGVDVFGIDAELLPDRHPHADLRYAGNLDLSSLHNEMAARRLYLHLNRWTSLGLSLLEAMHLGMPCVVLASTEAATLPDAIGAVSTDLGYLRERVARLVEDTDEARRCGRAARELARSRFALEGFIDGWDRAVARGVGPQLGSLAP